VTLPHIAAISIDFVGGILIDLCFLIPFSSAVTFARIASAARFRIQYAAMCSASCAVASRQDIALI